MIYAYSYTSLYLHFTVFWDEISPSCKDMQSCSTVNPICTNHLPLVEEELLDNRSCILHISLSNLQTGINWFPLPSLKRTWPLKIVPSQKEIHLPTTRFQGLLLLVSRRVFQPSCGYMRNPHLTRSKPSRLKSEKCFQLGEIQLNTPPEN